MKISKVESGLYRTEDYRFTILSDWTSANGGMKLVKCWKIYKHDNLLKVCKALGEAKDFVRLQYV